MTTLSHATATRRSHPDHVAAAPRPAEPAHIIASDAEAIAVAERLAAQFAPGAAKRDRERISPLAEIDAFSQSGLWSINVPRAYGGPELSYATMAKIIEIIAAADPSIGQIPQNHLGIVAAIRTVGSEAQKRLLFGEVLKGRRFGNAFSERGTKRAAEFATTLRPSGDGYLVNGEKFYCTGALLAHLVPIVASGEDGKAYYAIAERDAPGLTVIDDWSAFGQRTTQSGTVLLEDVYVPAEYVVPAYLGYENPSADGPIFQIVQVAIDAGIAAAAIADTIAFVRTKARPWVDSGQETAAEDHYTIGAIGRLQYRLHAAEALTERAGRAIDAAVATPNEATVTAAQVATAEAKIATTEIAIEATNKLFELAGTRSTLAEHNLDRHWRNARTHTLHDPVRWKYHAVGNYYLNGIHPPRHAWS
jgi:SfnB family sulfur acquisition oxidoreductase